MPPTKTNNKANTDNANEAIELIDLKRVTYTVPIVGLTPLITQRWSEKARRMMLNAQQSTARAKREAKDPEANFNEARYRLPDGRDGVPATAFKAAIVHSARLFDGVTQVALRQTIIVEGDARDDRGDALVAIDYENMIMREDTPRNASGVPDLRYRPQYWPWRATLRIRTIEGQIKDEISVIRLVNAAGIGGIGEWRPTSPKSATGTYGTFEVET
jgi:hypothetical protein